MEEEKKSDQHQIASSGGQNVQPHQNHGYIIHNHNHSHNHNHNHTLQMVIFGVFVALLSVSVSVYLQYVHDFFGWQAQRTFHNKGRNPEIYNAFNQLDRDQNGELSFEEFQFGFLAMRRGGLNISEVEPENFHNDVKEELNSQNISDHVIILNVKATMKPMDLNTMKKFQDEMDKDSPHLQGLKSWTSPNIDYANFSVSKFQAFLPLASQADITGAVWELIPKSFSSDSDRLNGDVYLPPHPERPIEHLLLYLLSMIHKRPFLYMRFPPRGGLACLRGVNDEYYDIIFRLHPEFQLNEPPLFPFWFTPAAIMGELTIKKDGSQIEYFRMYLPSRKQLNIDMEWLTNPPVGVGNYTQEVDIGYMEEMSITSTQPSAVKNRLKNNSKVGVKTEMSWNNQISPETAFDILEKEFYPFKKVPYLPFNETFAKARDENKLIHHILLWGSLDDQSC